MADQLQINILSIRVVTISILIHAQNFVPVMPHINAIIIHIWGLTFKLNKWIYACVYIQCRILEEKTFGD